MGFIGRFIAAWLAAILVLLFRWSARIRFINDPRPALRKDGKSYIFAVLHCHQVGAVMAGEPGTAAMVSRSKDGDLLVPSLKVRGCVAVRGSSRDKGRDKGGSEALAQLMTHVRSGKPAYLAVDGPRGPRNEVKPGIARLAQETGAVVLPGAVVPSGRIILKKTWDRMQIPTPFSRLDVHFGTPLSFGPTDSVDGFRARVEQELVALENRIDPLEAAQGLKAAARRRERFEKERAGTR